jgi:hypothetical protein
LSLKPHGSFSLIGRLNLRNTTTSSHRTLRRSTLPIIQRSLILIGLFENMSDLSTMCPLTTSINSAISKHAISKGTVLAKAAPRQRRKQRTKIALTRLGGKRTHAVYGMMGNVVIKHPPADSGTSANSVEAHIAKACVRERRILMPGWHHTARCTSEYPWYPGVNAVYLSITNVKPPRSMLGAAKK